MSNSYNEILRIQRTQHTEKEDKLRYIAAHAEELIDLLNKKVAEENAKPRTKNAQHQVFRGQTMDSFINSIVTAGAAAGVAPNELS